MTSFFVILGILIIPIIIIVGLVKPALYRISRKRILLFGLLGIFISLIGVGITAPEKTESEILKEKRIAKEKKQMKEAEKLAAEKKKVEQRNKKLVKKKVGEEQKVESEQKPIVLEPKIEHDNETEKSSIIKEKPVEQSFKEKCEANAEKYPPTYYALLFNHGSKENKKFSGMKYYFVGELIEIGVLDNKNTWFIRNEDNYIMPVFMYNVSEEAVGSKVEIWGTLTGEGYRLDFDKDNTGKSGSMIMNQYSVNGEEKQ